MLLFWRVCLSMLFRKTFVCIFYARKVNIRLIIKKDLLHQTCIGLAYIKYHKNKNPNKRIVRE